MHPYRLTFAASLIAAAAHFQADAAVCNIAAPVLPCEIGTNTYDTFAGNYNQNRSFYKAASYDTSIADGYLSLTIKDSLPHIHGYAYVTGYYGPTVWTSPDPYNAEFKVFGQFGGSGVELAKSFSWIGPGAIPSQNYGLFIGVRDPSPAPHDEFRSDLMASRLASAFSSRPDSRAFLLTGDLTGSFTDPIKPILRSEIHQKLSDIRALMKPTDTLSVYISGHGLSLGTFGLAEGSTIGDEAVYVGEFVTDNWLTSELQQFSGLRKMTFIDACHSGGFWGSGDLTELGGANDLDQLDNIALFAASQESNNTFYGADGLPFFGRALELALRDPTDRDATSLAAFLKSTARALASPPQYSDPAFYSQTPLGTPTPVNPLLLAPTLTTSADFDLNAPVLAVPELATFELLLFGISGLLVRRHLLTSDA